MEKIHFCDQPDFFSKIGYCNDRASKVYNKNFILYLHNTFISIYHYNIPDCLAISLCNTIDWSL